MKFIMNLRFEIWILIMICSGWGFDVDFYHFDQRSVIIGGFAGWTELITVHGHLVGCIGLGHVLIVEEDLAHEIRWISLLKHEILHSCFVIKIYCLILLALHTVKAFFLRAIFAWPSGYDLLQRLLILSSVLHTLFIIRYSLTSSSAWESSSSLPTLESEKLDKKCWPLPLPSIIIIIELVSYSCPCWLCLVWVPKSARWSSRGPEKSSRAVLETTSLDIGTIDDIELEWGPP